MMKRTLAVLAVLALTLTGFTAGASAQSDTDENRIQTISGTGILAAKGEGTVDLEMGGRLRMRLLGDVTITDNAGDMELRIRTAPERDAQQAADPESGTVVTLEDFDGGLVVRGSDFTVHAEGQVAFVARGHGTAHLDGTGQFRTRHRDWTPWVTGAIAIQPVDES